MSCIFVCPEAAHKDAQEIQELRRFLRELDAPKPTRKNGRITHRIPLDQLRPHQMEIPIPDPFDSSEDPTLDDCKTDRTRIRLAGGRHPALSDDDPAIYYNERWKPTPKTVPVIAQPYPMRFISDVPGSGLGQEVLRIYSIKVIEDVDGSCDPEDSCKTKFELIYGTAHGYYLEETTIQRACGGAPKGGPGPTGDIHTSAGIDSPATLIIEDEPGCGCWIARFFELFSPDGQHVRWEDDATQDMEKAGIVFFSGCAKCGDDCCPE